MRRQKNPKTQKHLSVSIMYLENTQLVAKTLTTNTMQTQINTKHRDEARM